MTNYLVIAEANKTYETMYGLKGLNAMEVTVEHLAFLTKVGKLVAVNCIATDQLKWTDFSLNDNTPSRSACSIGSTHQRS